MAFGANKAIEKSKAPKNVHFQIDNVSAADKSNSHSRESQKDRMMNKLAGSGS